MALPTRARPSSTHNQSFLSGNFHKPLILIHQRADKNENHNHRKLSKRITWTTALSNSVKLSHAMEGHWGRLGHGGELWQNTVHEKGMANHVSILALRTTWTVWKGTGEVPYSDTELPRNVHSADTRRWRNVENYKGKVLVAVHHLEWKGEVADEKHQERRWKEEKNSEWFIQLMQKESVHS